MAVKSLSPATPAAPITVMHTDAFMLPDVVADKEESNAVVNEWFRELEVEDPITRPVADTTHCAPLSAIFGSALGPLTDANADTI